MIIVYTLHNKGIDKSVINESIAKESNRVNGKFYYYYN